MTEGSIPATTIFGSQTRVNGQVADYRFNIGMNNIWRYRDNGDLWRDGQGDFMLVGGRPERSDTMADSRKILPSSTKNDQDFELIYDYSFVVSDGQRDYTIAVNDPDPLQEPQQEGTPHGHILTFLDAVPPRATDLLVVNPVVREVATTIYKDPRARIICFTPGTWIRTPVGPKLVEQLMPEDLVMTKDNGAKPIRWIGKRRMTGARLIAMPDMRPIRIRQGSLGTNIPDRDMWVSPRHRFLLEGSTANILFNTSEVLVAAVDLVNDRSITVDHQVKQTEYIHLLFEQHEVIWANGAEAESFHPGYALAAAVPHEQLQELYKIYPELENDPHGFGEPARKLLSAHEAAAFLYS